MPLNLRQMDVIRTVMSAGTISSAARELSVTQPAISRMISQTEEQLHLRLFARVRGRLHPTPEAHALLTEIERARDGVQRVNELAQALAEQRAGDLRVACSPSLAQSLVPLAVTRFGAASPEVTVHLRSSLVERLVPEVLNDEVEVGVCSVPAEHPNLNVTSLCIGRMVAIVPRECPLSSKRRLSLRDLSSYPMIIVGREMHFGRLVVEAFNRAGLPFRLWSDVPAAQLACALVNAGAGVALVDPFSVMGAPWLNVAARPLREAIPIHVTVLTSRTRPLSLVGSTFTRLLAGVALAHGFRRGAATDEFDAMD
jgi:DNA-binding transcriptional LysR family regulator